MTSNIDIILTTFQGSRLKAHRLLLGSEELRLSPRRTAATACPPTIRTLKLIRRSLIRFLLARPDQRRILFRVTGGNASHRVIAAGVLAGQGRGLLGVISRKDWKFWDDQLAPGSSGCFEVNTGHGNHHIMSVGEAQHQCARGFQAASPARTP